MPVSITFCQDGYSVSSSAPSTDLVISLEDTLILNPKILDGMGEKNVEKDGHMKKYAHTIFFSWVGKNLKQKEKCFSGEESYFLQSVIEDLESLQTGD